jgi:hypothetical protein
MMLDAVRSWFNRGGTIAGWTEFAAWARANHWTLKRTIARDGWAMDGNPAHPGWRIEWGPAQRSFMSSHEFRVRFEVAHDGDVQALVLDRPLLARLDHELYAQFTDHVQTRLDEETPEEMRWLAMHAKLSPNEMGTALRDRYGAVGNDTAWVSRWLSGPIAAALKQRGDVMPIESVSAEPFMLRLTRGHVVIRQSASVPRVQVLDTCVAVGEAVEEALRKG